jgi:hypothetical protein
MSAALIALLATLIPSLITTAETLLGSGTGAAKKAAVTTGANAILTSLVPTGGATLTALAPTISTVIDFFAGQLYPSGTTVPAVAADTTVQDLVAKYRTVPAPVTVGVVAAPVAVTS